MNSETLKPVVVIAGPTASGKSALAVDVALKFNGVVINADSMQVYRGLPVLSAMPGAEEMAAVPHRLYGVLDPGEPCSAGRWLEMAIPEIKAAWAEGRLPIVTGGTGLYLKALMDGISPLPPVSEGIRAEATALREKLGADAFHVELARVDAEGAAKIQPGDSQRAIRAYEIWLATGKALSQWQAENPPPGPAIPAAFCVITLVPDRDAVYAACDARFKTMIEEGALDEVRALRDRGLDPALPVMKAVGVPELLAHVSGEISLAEAEARAAQATRNYAKRQFTWLRNQLPGAHVVPAQYSTSAPGAQHSKSLSEEIFPFIRQFLLTTPI